MGQKAEVADAHEARGEYVEQEPAQELLDGKGHQTLLVAVRGVSPAERDLVTLQSDQAVIGDGHAVGIAAEITENMFWAPKGRLAIDHPVLPEQWAEECSECFGFCQKLEIPVEAQLALREGLPESGDKLATEDSPQHLDGKKEAVARGDPALVIGRETTGRNDTMQMGMMLEFLTPGMEHAEEADFGAQMAGITGDFEQRFGTGAEQEIVDDLLVLQGQRGELPRKREDDMDVGDRQEFATPRLQPTVASGGLTLGTVPIPAGIVRDGTIPAAGTLIPMPAQGGGAAALDGRQHFEMLAGDPATTRFDESLSRHPDEIGHLQRRPTHLFVSGRLVFLHRGSQRQGVQWTGGGAEMAVGKVQVDRGLFQIVVTEEHLDGAQVGPRFEQMSGKAMPSMSLKT